MKKTFFIFFTFFVHVQVLCFGANLHFMTLADDQTNIATACQLDLQRVQAEGERIALYSDLQLKKKNFHYSSTSPSDLICWIAQLQVEPDDVIVFYYSGHGYRFQEKDSIWPMLNVLNSPFGLDFKVILDAVKSKGARLSLIFADSCNSFIDGKPEEQKKARRAAKSMKNLYQIAKNYKKLYRETSGVIAMTGSDVGQYSWCDDLNGGFFTISFLRAMHSSLTLPTEQFDWALVLQETVKKVESLMDKSELTKEGYKQTPVYFYEPLYAEGA